MLELRQLKYFVKVAELEHFGQAAEELHVVQPALSRQVKQLEEELGLELFERLPRGVRLTAAGKVLLERARQLLADTDRAVTATRQAAQGKTGFVRIGFADGATFSGHLPSVIGKFRKRSPHVELELLPASSLNQAELLQKQSIDIGFAYWLPKTQTNIAHQKVNQERIVIAVAESNELAGRKTLHLSDLHDRAFIWFKRSSSPMYFDLIASECSKASLTLNVVQEAFLESTMLSLVAADIGVTFITEAAQKRKPDNVVLIPVQDMNATITLTAMWRADDRNPALKEFIATLKKQASY